VEGPTYPLPPDLRRQSFHPWMIGHCHNESGAVFTRDLIAYVVRHVVVFLDNQLLVLPEGSDGESRQIVETIRACELKDGDGGTTGDALTRRKSDQVSHMYESVSLAECDGTTELVPMWTSVICLIDQFENEGELSRRAVHVYHVWSFICWHVGSGGHGSEVFADVSANILRVPRPTNL